MKICKHIQTKTGKQHQMMVFWVFTSKMTVFSKLRWNMLPPPAGYIHVVQADVWITGKGTCVDYIKITSASNWIKMLPWRWRQNVSSKTSEQTFRPTRCNKSGIVHLQLTAVSLYVLAFVCLFQSSPSVFLIGHLDLCFLQIKVTSRTTLFYWPVKLPVIDA
jgi:hypothetical protein